MCEIGRNSGRAKGCGPHSGVVHHRNGAAHDHGTDDFPPARPVFIPQPEGKVQGHQRDCNGQRNRQRNNSAVINNHGRAAHGSHADIVHGRNPAAHDHAACDSLPDTHLRPADHEQRHPRGRDRPQQRKRHSGKMISNRHRHGQGEHADIVHRPDSQAHRRRSCAQPDGSHAAVRRGYASREIERGIGSKHRQHNGERHQPVVVAAA